MCFYRESFASLCAEACCRLSIPVAFSLYIDYLGVDLKAGSSGRKPQSSKLFQGVCLVKLVAVFTHSRKFIDFVPGTVQGSRTENERLSSWL